MAMSWYRIYRPQTVSGLHIKPVRDAFSRILSSGSFSHAYLLSGPKGTGKTSAARILAKVLNCEKNRDAVQDYVQAKTKKPKALVEPCNRCKSCVSINNGTSLSVVEMDAASNRGIDDVRLLREGIGLAPIGGSLCVYIIDEVHMLTTEAFNALLKILEEPPAHVVFILATTDPQKMPPTVLSRCVNIPYRKATTEEVVTRLTEIAASEKITIEPAALQEIAMLADGSFRDAVKLFEQIGKDLSNVTIKDVTAVAGTSLTSRVSALLNALMKKEIDEVLTLFTELDNAGIEGVAFQKSVLKTAHDKLVEFSKSSDRRLPTLVRLLRAIAVPIEPGIPTPALPFELSCLQWCLDTPEQHATKNAQPEKTPPIPVESAVIAVAPSRQKRSVSPPIQDTHVLSPEKSSQTVHVQRDPAVFDMETITKKWTEILKLIKSKSNPVEGLLRATHPVRVDGNILICEANYSFHKEQLEVERNRVIIETVLSQVLEGAVRIDFSLAEGAKKASRLVDSNISGSVTDDGLVQAAAEAFL